MTLFERVVAVIRDIMIIALIWAVFVTAAVIGRSYAQVSEQLNHPTATVTTE
jgi:hypothetical protein